MNDFIRTVSSHPIEGSSPHFQHRFGGRLDPEVFPPGGKAACHLLYTIDTEDPLFPIRIPGVRHLPLICCQQYNAAAMAYRVTRDSITVDWIEYLQWDADFPCDNYPSHFPTTDITLVPADQAMIDRLEAAQDDTLDMGHRFGGWHFLSQGVHEAECHNPSCDGGDMHVFGVIYNAPVKGVRLWDPDQEWGDTEIIYQICNKCSSIYVCNRCT